MKTRTPFSSFVLAGLCILVAGGALAQTARTRVGHHPLAADALVLVGDQASAQPKNFGTQNLIIEMIGSESFFPLNDGSLGYHQIGGVYRYSTDTLIAPLGILPNGALLKSFTVYYYDVDPTNDFEFSFCRSKRDTITGSNPDTQCLATFSSSGTPASASVLVPVPDQYQTILRQFDSDGDGLEESYDYYVLVNTSTPASGGAFLDSVRANWRRQVSPAPATATFNDVPTGDGAFQYIEALAASGITAGCSVAPPLYCPDNPLTRRQMAVFLAKALGLHWHPYPY
jgi:hypothetical protein